MLKPTNTNSISKFICAINPNLRLWHKLLFTKKNKTGGKISEIIFKIFKSSKYTNMSELKDIVINTSDYLILEFSDYNANREIVTEQAYISYPHMGMFRSMLNEAHKWFSSEDEYTDLLVQVEGKYYLNDKYENLSVYMQISNKKMLIIKPNLIEDPDTGITKEAVNLIFDNLMAITLTLDELENLKSLIDTFDFYVASLALYNTKLEIEGMNK